MTSSSQTQRYGTQHLQKHMCSFMILAVHPNMEVRTDLSFLVYGVPGIDLVTATPS